MASTGFLRVGSEGHLLTTARRFSARCALSCHRPTVLGNPEVLDRVAQTPFSRRIPVIPTPLMGPGFAASKGEIVGICGLPPSRRLGFDHLVWNALALAIGHRLFLGVESYRELLLHVAGGGPAHQRLDRARLFGIIVKLPFAGLGGPGLHRVFGGLKDACGHEWSRSVSQSERVSQHGRRAVRPAGIVWSHLSGILSLIPERRMVHFPDRYSHYTEI